MVFKTISHLKPGMILSDAVLAMEYPERFGIGTELTLKDIFYINEKGYEGIYVTEKDHSLICSEELYSKLFNAILNQNISELIDLSGQLVEEVVGKQKEAFNVKSVRSYDSYLPHHSIYVAVYSVVIGIQLGLGDIILNALAIAGLLHDLGTTKIDSAIINKHGALNEEEFNSIKQHPSISYDLVNDYQDVPNMAKDAILYHHENANGTGYPKGLSEDEIPLLARILHVADVYDAIMTRKIYKNPLSNKDALAYLSGGKSILFDGIIVDALISVAYPYITGVDVSLSDGKRGYVYAQTEDVNNPILFLKNKKKLVKLSDLGDEETVTESVSITSSLRNVNKKESEKSEPVEEQTEEQQEKKKILIVDDVYVSIFHTQNALGADYDVVSCGGGTKALVLVETEKPDLILMDYEMPDMDGVTTVMKLRNAGCNVPVIFLTGKSDKETVMACSKTGAVDYILKPANPVYLRVRVEKALEEAYF